MFKKKFVERWIRGDEKTMLRIPLVKILVEKKIKDEAMTQM